MGVFDSTNVTPKAALTLRDIGNGFDKSNVTVGGWSTLRLKRDKANASISISDRTVREPKSKKDLVGTFDYKLDKGFTLNSKFDAGTEHYNLGGTWDGTIQDRAATLKLWYSNRDDLVSGESWVAVKKGQKAHLTFNQKTLLTAKYSLSRNDYLVEPYYNFVKESPGLSVTKKLTAKEDAKLSYDVKSELAAAEYIRKPFKVVLTSKVNRKLRVGKPTLYAYWEKTYDI